MARTILGEWANGTRDLIGDRVVQNKHTVYGVQVQGLFVGVPVPSLAAAQVGTLIRLTVTPGV